MTEYEYQAIQNSFRHKLNNNPYARSSWKKEEAYEEGLKAAMSILSNFHRSRKDSAWISVGDRLPTEYGRYLVCCKAPWTGKPYTDILHFDPVTHCWFWEDSDGSRVQVTESTHWMSMPEIPKEVSQ